jgi:acyl-CoA thioesterase II
LKSELLAGLQCATEVRAEPTRFWLRCTAELPGDPLLHAAVLAYTSDLSTGLVALEDDKTEAGPSLDHAIWFHRPARMDDWMWHELEPHAVSGGRGWYTGAVYAADGSRVASFAQEQLFRTRQPTVGRFPVGPESSFGTSG